MSAPAAYKPRHRNFGGSSSSARCFTGFATLPYLIAGALFLFAHPAAPYWLAAAITLSFLKSFMEAWVLLIEINRLTPRVSKDLAS